METFKNHFLTCLVVLCSVLSLNGQALDVTHYMRMSPFQHNNLPSSSTIYNGYFSLATGNIQVGLNLGGIRYKNLFETDDEGYPTVLTATKFVNHLSNKNYVGFYDDIELLGVGFRIKSRYFLSIDYRQRANLDLAYSRDVLGFPIYGNMAYVENPADLDMSVNLNAYQELGVSFRHKVNNNIMWGVRPKLLFGIANVSTKNLSAQISTDPQDYTITMTYAAAMRAAAIMPFNMKFNQQDGFQFEADYDVRNIMNNVFKNVGFGIDLGFSYKLKESINLSAALLDLGFINWKTSTMNMNSNLEDAGGLYNDGSFMFSGLSQSQIQSLMEGQGISDFLDTLAQYFPLQISPTGRYATALTPRVVFQADYDFGKYHRVSASTQFRFAKKFFQPSLTIAYDGCFFNTIDVCVAYTLQRNSYDNLGIGLGFNLGFLNVYAGTQNIIAAFSVRNVSQITATAGVAFNWGHYKNWRENHPKKQKSLKEDKKEEKSEP